MARPRLLPWLLTVALWLAVSGAAFAAPGDLDPTFGSGGKALVDLGGDEVGSALALQPDGRIIVGGSTSKTAGEDGAVARLLSPQGTLDPSYSGGSGWSRLDLGGLDAVTGVAQQSDGRIVAAVTSTVADSFTSSVVRLLNPGGGLDPAFGSGAGFVQPTLLPDEYFSALVLQPDERIVVAGDGDASVGFDMTVARLLGGGALDTAYGGGLGWSRLDFPAIPGGGAVDEASAVALQPDGRIVVAGDTTAGQASRRDIAVARLLNPQGGLDSSFGPAANGSLRIDMGGQSIASAVAVQPDGGIVVAGSTTLSGHDNATLVRLLPAGTPDPSFSDDGRITTSAGGDDEFAALAIQADGKIVAAGSTGPTDGPRDMLVMRFQPNGQADTTFGGGGRVVVDLGGSDVANALALQPDGRIVLVGDTSAGSGDLAVARLEGDPPAGPGGVGVGGGGAAGGGAGGGGAGGSPSTGVPRCAGKPATIIGTPGRDRLKGTRKADVIVGLGGDDVIAGLGGDDIICGGPGADALTGGAGADRLLGQGGADAITGGAGADILTGGRGSDRLLGGAGRDLLSGGAGSDRLLGGPGIDVLTGGPGKNVRTQ